MGTQQGLDERWQEGISGGLGRHDNQVARTDSSASRRSRGQANNALSVEVTHHQTTSLEDWVIATADRMHFMAAQRQEAAIPTADRTCADDDNLHGRLCGRRTEVWRAAGSLPG